MGLSMPQANAEYKKRYEDQWSAHVDELYKVGFNLGSIEDADEMASIISRAKQLIKVAAQNVSGLKTKDTANSGI